MPITIGLVFVVSAIGLFGYVAMAVVNGGPLTIADVHVARWLHARSSPPMTQAMLVVTHLHDTIPITIAVALGAVYLALKRNWYWLLCVGATVPIGMLLNVALSHTFQRARPIFDDPLLLMTTYSFPSGHVAGATLFYGVLAALLVSRTHNQQWRIAIVLAAGAMVGFVALTRLYLGVHYLSDILAAFAEGIAWLAICLTSIQAWWNAGSSSLTEKVGQ